MTNPFEAGVECTDFASKVPLGSVRETYDFDPWVARSVTFDDIGGPVSGPVVNNNPFVW
jgi:hypothetical protein